MKQCLLRIMKVKIFIVILTHLITEINRDNHLDLITQINVKITNSLDQLIKKLYLIQIINTEIN